MELCHIFPLRSNIEHCCTQDEFRHKRTLVGSNYKWFFLEFYKKKVSHHFLWIFVGYFKSAWQQSWNIYFGNDFTVFMRELLITIKFKIKGAESFQKFNGSKMVKITQNTSRMKIHASSIHIKSAKKTIVGIFCHFYGN